jgi:hypothetical protein
LFVADGPVDLVIRDLLEAIGVNQELAHRARQCLVRHDLGGKADVNTLVGIRAKVVALVQQGHRCMEDGEVALACGSVRCVDLQHACHRPRET